MQYPATEPSEQTPCLRCAYPLPDLSPAAVCPECGTPVEHTLRGDRLAAADPAYLDQVLRGLRRMEGAALLCAAGVGTLVLTALVGEWLDFASEIPWVICQAICLIAAGLVWPAGVRDLTAREEPVRAPARDETVRRWARAAARWQRPTLALCALALVLDLLPLPAGWWDVPAQVLGPVLLIGALALVAAQLVTIPWHIRDLARRIPAKQLMTSARSTLTAGLAALALPVGEHLIPPTVPLLPFVLQMVSGLALLVLPFAIVILLREAEKEIDLVRSRVARGAAAPDSA